MASKHQSRLVHLMEKFNVTAKELSEAIHVDHSLVSKWRNNKRTLSPRSPHLEHIASFFINLDVHIKFNTLNELLKDYYPTFCTEATAMKTILLKKWLISDTEEVNNETLLKTMSKRGTYTAEFDVLKGNQGRRLASQRLMELAMTLPPGQKLLLYSESSEANWYTEDQEFHANWRKNYLKMLNRGNSVSLIHSIDRNIKSLINILLDWLPMELTGSLHSYYFPKFTDSLLKPTVLAIKDIAAVFSMSPEDRTKTIYTHFFTDPITVEQAETIFYALLANCRKLYDSYTKEHTAALLDKMLAAQEQPENSYWYSPQPMLLALPKSLLADICQEQQTEQRQKLYKIQELFLQNLQTGHCRLIMDINLPELIMRNQPAFCHELAAAGANKQLLSQLHMHQYILHLLSLLQKYPNFEIAFAQNLPAMGMENVSLYVKENTAARICSCLPGSNEPITLLSQEPSIVHAYYYHFEEFWSSVPRMQREKEWVVGKLYRMLENTGK